MEGNAGIRAWPGKAGSGKTIPPDFNGAASAGNGRKSQELALALLAEPMTAALADLSELPRPLTAFAAFHGYLKFAFRVHPASRFMCESLRVFNVLEGVAFDEFTLDGAL